MTIFFLFLVLRQEEDLIAWIRTLPQGKSWSIQMIYQSAYSQFRSTGSRQDRSRSRKIDHCEGAMYAELTGIMQPLLLAGDAGMDGVVVEES
ncbi:hypothetical protein EJB05_24453, partial [Eragrostis curvula]